MGLLHHAYLNDHALKGLANYKYKASGYTWLDDLHNPVWNWLVENTLPLWLAPNLVTLTGLTFIMASTVLMFIFSPQLNGEDAPGWVHTFGGIGIIMYVNLDCMDGKQARRTGSSSPLGQLFDHGCDALSVGLILFNVATSVGLGYSSILVCMAYVPMLTWILAQWEEYHTGNMLYGNGIFGVLEANYSLAIAQIISGTYGVHVWQTPIQTFMHFPVHKALESLTPLQALFGSAMICTSIQGCGQIYRVFTNTGNAMDAKEKGCKDLGFIPALKHLLYFVILFCSGYLFLQIPAEGYYHARSLIMFFNMAYTIMATQLIIAHMAKENFRPFWGPVVAMTLCVANEFIRFVPSDLLTYVLLGAIGLFYMHFISNVIDQVCHTLGIKCFVLPKAKAV